VFESAQAAAQELESARRRCAHRRRRDRERHAGALEAAQAQVEH